MSLDICVPTTKENSLAILRQSRTSYFYGSRISRYEFEQLLQRAAEIQNARDLAAQIMASLHPQA